MSAHYTLYPYNLPSHSNTAGANWTQTLRDLPKTLFGRLAHLVKIVYSSSITPTYTTAPTVYGQNAIEANVDFWDGVQMRFQGGFNFLRMREKMHTGRTRLSDPTTAAGSTNNIVLSRVWHAGPPQFENAPADWMIPCGFLENGEIRGKDGALTDYSADTTVLTVTTRITAWLALMDEIRIPPAVQFVNQAWGSSLDTNLAGRSLYVAIAAVSATLPAAHTAGKIGNVRVDYGQGEAIPTVKINSLQQAYRDDFAAGVLEAVACEPEVTTYDTNEAIINRGANPATALATPQNDLAMIAWSPPGARISKLPIAESVVRVRADGTATTAVLLIERILPQPGPVLSAAVQKSVGRLNLRAGTPKFKTDSHMPYKGAYGEFMPVKVKV